MSPRRRHERVYQPIGEPLFGARFVGYVRYSSVMQDAATISTQKRAIQEFAEKKGWDIVRWYEEPAHSAKYDDIDQRPVFAQMLNDAGGDFQGVLVYDNSRWARSDIVGPEALRRLRAKRIWWATADGKFTVDNVQDTGPGIWHAIDTKLNSAFIVQLSKRVIDGKEDRAREGWHQGQPSYGYLPPEYAPPPPGIGTNWRAPRAPVRPDPETWPALELIAELRLSHHSCREIAIALNEAGFRTRGKRWHGVHDETQGDIPSPRLFTEDSVRTMLISPFYREFAPGSGKGTIISPAGHRIQGRHVAAWDWSTWHKLDEVAAILYHAPKAATSSRGIYPFGGIIVCAGCGRPMRCAKTMKTGRLLRYYRCSSPGRMLTCTQAATTPAWRVERAFGRLLLTYHLGEGWQEDLRSLEEGTDDHSEQDYAVKRKSLMEEQEAYNLMLISKGVDSARYQRETARIQSALAALDSGTAQEVQFQSEVEAGETLIALPELWEAAREHDDVEALRELAVSLLQAKGIAWDSYKRAIVAIMPHDEYVPSLRIALRDWQWDGKKLLAPAVVLDATSSVRLTRDKRVKTKIRREQPASRYSLTPVQQQEARLLLAEGRSIRDVAKRFSVSHSAIWRLRHRSEEE